LFGGRREVTRHDVASDPNNWSSTSPRVKDERATLRSTSRGRTVRSAVSAVLRRRPRHRDGVAPSDCYRASTLQSETRRAAVRRRCRSSAEAAAVARAVVSMLRLYVVCLVCFF